MPLGCQPVPVATLSPVLRSGLETGYWNLQTRPILYSSIPQRFRAEQQRCRRTADTTTMRCVASRVASVISAVPLPGAAAAAARHRGDDFLRDPSASDRTPTRSTLAATVAAGCTGRLSAQLVEPLLLELDDVAALRIEREHAAPRASHHDPHVGGCPTVGAPGSSTSPTVSHGSGSRYAARCRADLVNERQEDRLHREVVPLEVERRRPHQHAAGARGAVRSAPAPRRRSAPARWRRLLRVTAR